MQLQCAALLVVYHQVLQFVHQHLLGDCLKHFVDVHIVLGRGLQQLDVHLMGEPLDILGGDDFAIWIVVFVTN